MTDWIDFAKQSPDDGGRYLVFAPSMDPEVPFVTVAWWSTRNQRWELLPAVWAKAVTHWMPLPKPPEGELLNG